MCVCACVRVCVCVYVRICVCVYIEIGVERRRVFKRGECERLTIVFIKDDFL